MKRSNFFFSIIAAAAALSSGRAWAQADAVNFMARSQSTASIGFVGSNGTRATHLGTVTPFSGWTYQNRGPHVLYLTVNAGNNDCHWWSAQTPAGLLEGRDDCENVSSFGAFFLSPGQTFRFDGQRVPRLSVTVMAEIAPGDWAAAGFRAPVNIAYRHAYDGNRFAPCPDTIHGPAISGSMEYRRYRDLIIYNYGPQEYGFQYEVLHSNTCLYPNYNEGGAS